MKRRISPIRYHSMLYPDITGYPAAAVDVSQGLYLLQDALNRVGGAVPDKQARLADVPVKSFGWDWAAGQDMTLGEVIGRCITAQGVLFDATQVVVRVEHGIDQAIALCDGASVLWKVAADAGHSELARRYLSEASHYEQVVTLLRRVLERKSMVPRVQVTRVWAYLRAARSRLREAERTTTVHQ